jgi:hypothetical protein
MRVPGFARPARALFASALLCGSFVLLGERGARAYYEEAHVTSDQARVIVDTSGIARIEHVLSWHIVAGQPRSFDLVGTEASAQPDTVVTLESEDGRSLTGTVAVVPGRGLRVTVNEPKALHHGQQYRVRLAYGVNLVDAGELAREGATYRLTWKAPIPSEGYEGPTVTFVLPGALEQPSALIGEGGMRDDGVTSALKREPDHDELSLIRPHVGRGEEVVWAARIAAKAFDGGRSPALAAPPPPPTREDPPGPNALVYGVVALLALAFGSAVRFKERRFDEACQALKESARGLVPLRSWERGAAAGAALFAGISLQLAEFPRAGALVVACAMAGAALRPARSVWPTRGPGRWLVLKPEEAFARPRRRLLSDVFDATRLAGIVVCAVGVALFAAAGHLVAPTIPEAPRLLVLDSLVLLPLFVTGRSSQVSPDRVARSAPWLARVFRRLQRSRDLRVSPWARVPMGLVKPDEARILVLPREPLPGLAGIEVGLAWRRSATSFVGTPEVLVRVREATAASARMTSLAPHVVPVPGRKSEERVYRLTPRTPTRKGTVALVQSLGKRLIDRRVVETEWSSEERRLPPAARAPEAMNVPSPVTG